MKSKDVSSTEERITEAGLNGSSAKMLKPGTLLYSIFASIGAVGILRIPAATNQAIAGLSIKTDSINQDYLFHYLKSRESLAKSSGRGAAQSNINLTILRNMEAPVPSLAVQKTIVKQLEAVLTQLGDAKKQLSALDSLVKSRFVEMFGDSSACINRWPTSRLDGFARVITGNTPSRKCPEYYGEGTEWVKTDNITDSVVTTAAEQLTDAGREKARIAPAGSILMACIAGSVKSIGKVGLLDREVAFNQQINAIVPGDKVDARFLLTMLSLSKTYLCSDVNQQLKGILNKSALSAKQFPLPPLELQQEFAAFAAQVDKSRFVAQQQIEKLQMLYDSLAQDYFGD